MKLFAFIFFSSAISILTKLAIAEIYLQNSVLDVGANALFVITLTVLVARDRGDVFDGGRSIVLAPAAYVVAGVLAMLAGGMIYPEAHLLGHVLMSPALLGYYPSGQDMLFSHGAFAWVLSTLGMIFTAMSAGALVRIARSKHEQTAEF